MKKQNSINIALSILLLAVAALACGGYQTAEADKLVDDANKSVDAAKEMVIKTEARNTKLFSVDIKTVAQLQYYKAQMKDEAQDIAADFAKAAELATEAGKKFSAAAKLNLPDKYKEYLDLKAQEFARRAEALNVRKGNAQAFVDYTDIAVMNKRFNENNSKSEKLYGDADELAKKAEKLHDDNKEIFKS